VLERHDRTDARWLDYEIDVAKLLDFPLMTDMARSTDRRLPQGQEPTRTGLRPDSVDDHPR